jgi:RHS repeat-associated protein
MKKWPGTLHMVFAGLSLGGLSGQASGAATTATLYVGQHFEVRTHDVPVKYVFSGATRVARTSGSLAPTRRIQRLRLQRGWNLSSSALSLTNALWQITNTDGSNLSSQTVFRWDDLTLSWTPLLPGQDLAAGAVLWLHSKAPLALPLVGTYEAPASRDLGAGGKFLPSAGLEEWNLKDAVSNVLSAVAWTYDSATGGWYSWLGSTLSAESDLPAVVNPGSAVFVRAAAPATLEVPESALRLRYYHEDHLGSSSVITDADGEIVQESALYPFGLSRNTQFLRQIEDPYQFTQKERDVETRSDCFQARYFSPVLSRFWSVDPRFAEHRAEGKPAEALVGNPQGLNPYAYTLNEPLRYVDPDGRDPSPIVAAPILPITTPLSEFDTIPFDSGEVRVTLSDRTRVVVEPDRYVGYRNVQEYWRRYYYPRSYDQTLSGGGGFMGYTELRIDSHYYKGRGDVLVWVTLQTSYAVVSKECMSGVGSACKNQVQGVNASQDPKQRRYFATTGALYLDYMNKHPLPAFNAGRGPVTEELYEQYQRQLIEYQRDMEFEVGVRLQGRGTRSPVKEHDSK